MYYQTDENALKDKTETFCPAIIEQHVVLGTTYRVLVVTFLNVGSLRSLWFVRPENKIENIKQSFFIQHSSNIPIRIRGKFPFRSLPFRREKRIFLAILAFFVLGKVLAHFSFSLLFCLIKTSCRSKFFEKRPRIAEAEEAEIKVEKQILAEIQGRGSRITEVFMPL